MLERAQVSLTFHLVFGRSQLPVTLERLKSDARQHKYNAGKIYLTLREV